MPKIWMIGYGCERCGHEWRPREAEQAPRVCPHCKNPYWDAPKRGKKSRFADAMVRQH